MNNEDEGYLAFGNTSVEFEVWYENVKNFFDIVNSENISYHTKVLFADNLFWASIKFKNKSQRMMYLDTLIRISDAINRIKPKKKRVFRINRKERNKNGKYI